MYDTTWADLQRREDGRAPQALTFVPGVDFDPYDAEEVEIVKLATERSAAERMRRLEEENAQLRAQLLAQLSDGNED